MDKIVLTRKPLKNKTIEYMGVEIEIVPFFSAAQIVYLINQYVKEYFGNNTKKMTPNSSYNLLEAEFNQKYYILQTNTNIDTEKLDNDVFVDSELWENIALSVSNYGYFRELQDRVISDIKEQIFLENSVGTVLAELAKKADDLLGMAEDFSPEKILEAKEQLEKLSEKLEESSIVNPAPRKSKKSQ